MNVAEPLGCDDAGADEFLDLTVLLAELRRDYGVAASYSRLWGALVDGRIPGVRDGNRWKVASRDKPLAARVLSYRPGPGGARRNIANAACTPVIFPQKREGGRRWRASATFVNVINRSDAADTSGSLARADVSPRRLPAKGSADAAPQKYPS